MRSLLIPLKMLGRVLKRHPRILKIIISPLRIASSMQLSKNTLARIIGEIIIWPTFWMLAEKYYKLILFSKKNYRSKTTFKFLKINRLQLKAMNGDKSVTEKEYQGFLIKNNFKASTQLEWAAMLMDVGRVDLARICLLDIVSRTSVQLSLATQIHVWRFLGAACFMLGNNDEAISYWETTGLLKRRLTKKGSKHQTYRILGQSWFLAIGHVAMLDFYAKYSRLYFPENRLVVAVIDKEKVPGNSLLYKFEELGFIFFTSYNELEKHYNEWAKVNDFPEWNTLSDEEHASMIDEFWEFDFPNGDTLGFAHAACRIQTEWELKKQKPLLSITDSEKRLAMHSLRMLGLPQDAWYVCLHVRESGFHKDWNSLYPTMRDADIETYKDAIRSITDRGGWVIRMGDSSMKPLPKMNNVIDYALSPFSGSLIDVLVVANARFFIGTNSGFSIVASIFCVPCLLTNWVPIGWPMWCSHEFMIPKLFRNKETGQYLSLPEMFSKNLAYLQNIHHLPADVEIENNTSFDLTRSVEEMFNYLSGKARSEEMKKIDEQYRLIAAQNGSYVGSQLIGSFVKGFRI